MPKCRSIEATKQKCTVNSDYHTHPIVEEVRHSKTESELIQAIGRARAIRRTKENPLDILVLTNVPISLKVDSLTTWKEVVPTKLEMRLANENIALLSYNELKRICPNLLPTDSKAKTAVKSFYNRYPIVKTIVKSNLSAILPIYSINRENDTQFQHYKELVLVQYTRTIKGAKPCYAVIYGLEAKQIEQALMSLVGELKNYRYLCAFNEKVE